MKIFAILKTLWASRDIAAQMETKNWYASKTIWFNTILFAAAAVTNIFGYDLRQWGLDENVYNALALVAATVGNFCLRLVTKQPVGLPSQSVGGPPGGQPDTGGGPDKRGNLDAGELL